MSDGHVLDVSPGLRLPLAELEFRATRSGGPGGQHVNTSSTRVEVSWDLAGSPSLTTRSARSAAAPAGHAGSTAPGDCGSSRASSRSQLRNREDVDRAAAPARGRGAGGPQGAEADEALTGGQGGARSRASAAGPPPSATAARREGRTDPPVRPCRLSKRVPRVRLSQPPGSYGIEHHAAAFRRSKLRYWMASLTWVVDSSSAPARSAIVRPIFRMRW